MKIKLPDSVSRFLESKWVGPVGLLIAVLAPFVSASAYSLNIMTTALIFVMLAVGLNIVVGYAGLLDLGYVAFMAVGAYTSGMVSKALGWPLLFTVPIVIVVTIVAGLIIGAPTLRLRSDYLAIVTLGFGEIIRIVANNLDITGGPQGIFGIPGYSMFGLDLDSPAIFYYITLGTVALGVLFAARLSRSRMGRAWHFVRQDEDAAEAMGVNTYKLKLMAYIFGAIWGGLAGVMFAGHLSAISPKSFVFLQSALILMAVVLGGMGHVRGVVVGALIISLIPEFFRDFAEYRYIFFGVVLVVVMLVRPKGLWPEKMMEKLHRKSGKKKAVVA